MIKRLRVVESKLRAEAADSDEELQTRCYVDTGPLVERVYAKYAGVGWIGKEHVHHQSEAGVVVISGCDLNFD